MTKWFPRINASKEPLCYKAFNFSPAEKVCSRCPARKTLKNGQVHESITTHQKDGGKNYKITSFPIKNERDNVIAAIALFEDVSEREKSDEPILESEGQLRSLIWHFPIYLTSIDKSGKIQFWSPYQEKLLGYTAEEAIGKLTPYMIHESKKEVDDYLQIASEKGICDVETTFVHKNGSMIPIHLVVVPNKDQSGNIDGFYGFAVDITGRKRAEKALKESERELRVLSAKLLSIQEDEKKRIALELHDSIGQNLQAIKFAITNIFKHMDEAKGSPIVRSLNEAISMIDEAIEESRKIAMDLRPAVLDDLGILPTISWFFRKFREVYPSIHIEKHITVKERHVPESLKVVIFRILQEAFNNIAKHSLADLVHFYLNKKGQGIELIIKDNGRGFNLEKVLPLESSRRGFGLASMRERTRLSGGIFSIKSILGKGTTLRASWPGLLLKGDNCYQVR